MEAPDSSAANNLVRIGVELGLAVNDYNASLTENLDEVAKLTLAYLAGVKIALKQGVIGQKDIKGYFALVGQTWGSVQPRFDNEYLDLTGGPA